MIVIIVITVITCFNNKSQFYNLPHYHSLPSLPAPLPGVLEGVTLDAKGNNIIIIILR